ncbi:multidrug transporter subunit MdtN [Dokdonella sp.]|uniref:multidrug transporter subunit MdtN n=1 Tax=Dokdonella sp. TaxID=2291710 RepID=UPI003C3BB689
MKIAGQQKRSPKTMLISLAIIAMAVMAVFYASHRRASYPASDDASFYANVVHIAASVGGRVSEIAVQENAKVQEGDLLFRIDPEPYRLAVAQAAGDLEIAEGLRGTRLRSIESEKSTAQIAQDQTGRAQTNYDLAKRTVERLRPLAAKGYVTKERFDQALTAEQDGRTSLAQARTQETATRSAVGTEQAADATVNARKAALALAERSLDNTNVTAPNDGRVVGLKVSPGEMIAPGQSLFTLINTEQWFASANFRETDLARIQIGDCATVYSMINRNLSIAGTVEGIGWGVLQSDQIGLSGTVPFVNRSLNWVQVAQRFPVRIRLSDPPERLVRLGASAVVEIGHGNACR